MIILVLILLGLCLGSFVNALVWRIYKVSGAKSKAAKQKYSIISGRSMCVHCKHELATTDLVPVLSWLVLRGKCRYCCTAISWQYPVVELATSALFVASYVFWPIPVVGYQVVSLCLWLATLVVMMAMSVYDIRWKELPDGLNILLGAIIHVELLLALLFSGLGLRSLGASLLAGFVCFGFFWVLFQVSKGNWIGGGDVKLGFALGVIAGDPFQVFLLIFIASLLGTVISLPVIFRYGVRKAPQIPFGPYLLGAAVIVHIFGADLVSWYKGIAGL